MLSKENVSFLKPVFDSAGLIVNKIWNVITLRPEVLDDSFFDEIECYSNTGRYKGKPGDREYRNAGLNINSSEAAISESVLDELSQSIYDKNRKQNFLTTALNKHIGKIGTDIYSCNNSSVLQFLEDPNSGEYLFNKLAYNVSGYKQVKSLPVGLDSEHLKGLNIGYTGISLEALSASEIESWFNSNLEVLNIAKLSPHNADIPSWIENCHNLEDIDVSDTYLDSIGRSPEILSPVTTLVKNHKLTRIKIVNSHLRHLPGDWIKAPITHLNVKGNPDMRLLGDLSKTASLIGQHLQYLDMRNTDLDLYSVSAAFPNLRTLIIDKHQGDPSRDINITKLRGMFPSLTLLVAENEYWYDDLTACSDYLSDPTLLEVNNSEYTKNSAAEAEMLMYVFVNSKSMFKYRNAGWVTYRTFCQ